MTTRPSAVLLDIEGTTTPISFVYEQLFPFARAALAEFLRKNWNEAEVQADMELLRQEQALENAQLPEQCRLQPGLPAEQQSQATAYALWLMDQDRKATGLKSLQGKIWKEGYANGELFGQVFPDVRPALERWKAEGRLVAIYSSGSVVAQKLLFGHSTAGDLTPWLDAYFDTRTGPKREAASYQAIAKALEVAPENVVFATDVVEEADAAGAAGLQPVLMDRPDNPQQKPHSWPVHRDFEDL